MLIIPAIDLRDGRVVRLRQGDFERRRQFDHDPVELARRYADAGARWLHLVDLDGAKEKRVVNWKVLELIAAKTRLHIDFGGGVQSDEDLRMVFECGAKQVTGGSIAVKKPDVFEKWLSQFGPETIILGADAKNEKIAVSGWEEDTQVWVYDFVEKYVEKGVKYIISTDVAKDGLLEGPSFDLYRNLQERFPDLNIIASGGVSGMQDLEVLADMNLFGVIVGKAIYEGRVTLKELSMFLK